MNARKTYGYVRVSTKEQNEGRQLIAMREFGIADKNVIVEKQSGKDFEPKDNRFPQILSLQYWLIFRFFYDYMLSKYPLKQNKWVF